METISMILIIAAIVLSMVVVIKILAAPVKLVFKILINAASGFVLLIVANIISGFFDFSLPIDFINCLVYGVFGIPGVAFLIVIKLLF